MNELYYSPSSVMERQIVLTICSTCIFYNIFVCKTSLNIKETIDVIKLSLLNCFNQRHTDETRVVICRFAFDL